MNESQLCWICCFNLIGFCCELALFMLYWHLLKLWIINLLVKRSLHSSVCPNVLTNDCGTFLILPASPSFHGSEKQNYTPKMNFISKFVLNVVVLTFTNTNANSSEWGWIEFFAFCFIWKWAKKLFYAHLVLDVTNYFLM